MKVIQLLSDRKQEILDEAALALLRARLTHYVADGQEVARERLGVLLDLLLDCVSRSSLAPMTDYSRKVAERRYEAGFGLHEVQTAFNVLEEIVWRRILDGMKPEEFGEAIGLVSTVLGAGKDTLARTYVTLATRHKAPSLDLRALFAGTTGP